MGVCLTFYKGQNVDKSLFIWLWLKMQKTKYLTVNRFSVRLICPGNMEQLSCIVSEYWLGQDLDGQIVEVTTIPLSHNLAKG